MGSLTRKLTKRARGYQLVKDFLKKAKEQQENFQQESVTVEKNQAVDSTEKEAEDKPE